MPVTEPSFTWNAGSFALALIVCLHISTVATTAELYYKRQSKYYLALLIISCMFLLHIILINVVAMAFDPAVPEGRVNDSTKRLSFFLTFLETAQMIAFTLLNYFRLYRLCFATRMMLMRFLGALVIVAVVFNIVTNSGIVYYLAQNYQYYYIPHWNQVYAYWVVYDATLNFAIAMVFIVHLRGLTGGGQQIQLRQGFSQMLLKVQVVLLIESVFLIVAALIVVFAPQEDPLWFLLYGSMAFRLRSFATFLNTLNRMMSSSVQSSGKHSSSSGQHHDHGLSNSKEPQKTTTHPSAGQSKRPSNASPSHEDRL